ncbi:hypothetical protein CHL67_05735 [Prosthecochloris sp. GSB1]|uniref:nuclear transport factor 2 family protein n=1 Tax=Prosthecochloris sp. GSB1 TaxID=281093 RepID=UPI000B8D041A|nr:nuclear transport factor 2 family protein [Prosthecochloris sp. GSB1]ASQ90489.1 hypothetical protein CHL67_05735 [Prosthecochloris sp. GSB1]
MRSARILLAFTFLLLSAFPLNAAESDSSLGEQLVRKLFADMKAGDVAAVEAVISQAFQSIHQDGTRDRDQEIELVRNLNMGELTLDDFKTSRSGDLLVVTYSVSVNETIDGNRLSSSPAYRLTVFQKEGGEWRWIAHANLKPLL